MVNPLFGVNAGRKLRSVSAPESAAAREEVEGGRVLCTPRLGASYGASLKYGVWNTSGCGNNAVTGRGATSRARRSRDRRILPDGGPSLLGLARRAWDSSRVAATARGDHGGALPGVSSDVIATQRDTGARWTTIAQRYGVGAGVFCISFPPETSLGPLESTYQSFSGTPRESWNVLAVDDPDLVALVNIRILSNELAVDAAEVLCRVGKDRQPGSRSLRTHKPMNR